MSSSRYSTDTPDYASTISEERQPRKLPEREYRPRSGVLKSIGNPDLKPKPELLLGDAHYKPEGNQSGDLTEIPTIDFGPTYSLAPDAKRPGTSGTMTQMLHDDDPTRTKENVTSSPGEQKRQSWLSGRTTPNMLTHMRSSSASPNFSDTTKVPWQPGMTYQNHSDRQKLDPDEWVAQRAAAAYPPRESPVFAHSRTKSHTPPPMNRTQSGDWAHLQRTPEATPGRPPSRPLSRPVSRGAGHLLDQRPISLSAREQEQVARRTGTPLIDLGYNAKKPQEASSEGLAAYIDHREKEKAKAKSSRNTAAMQAEIDRRYMAAQQRQMLDMQQMGQHMAMPQSNYAPSMIGTPSMMGTPPMIGTPQGLQQAFAYSSPGQMQQMYQQQPGYFPQQSYTPGMPQGMQQGWGAPSPQPMQGQYFVQQQTPQPYTQPYGASFDQAQAAARFAQQQGQSHRRG